ncbi:hypothetical protein [Paenibacillus protaetiae]|uniref:hypothetical protein n=1 Tax=Paenibacillus protaetiae TaxID=2509456 RepID=UPI001ABDE04F|nr:hypothetical protein [Paenibacillus protaetiae]
MIKRVSALLLVWAVIIASASGCAYEQRVHNSDEDYGSRETGDPKMIGGKMYGASSGNPYQHDNSFFEYSSKLSNAISSLNGIAGAIVMLTDKNAYAGIMLDWTAVGTKGSSKTSEQNNGGMGEGVYNHQNGSPYWDNRKLVTPYNSYFSVNDHSELSSELKQTIAVKIREMAPMVQEVYISANKEYVNELNEFAKEAWLGHSLMPWLNDFNILVKHQFAGGQLMPGPIANKKTTSAKGQWTKQGAPPAHQGQDSQLLY